MKQLWLRLGIAGGILGTGGTGVFVAQQYYAQEPSRVANAATKDPKATPVPDPIPLPADDFGPGAPAVRPHDVIRASDEVPVSAGSRYGTDSPIRPSARFASGSSPVTASIADDDTGESEAPDTRLGHQTYGAVPMSNYGSAASAASPYASRYGDRQADSAPSEPPPIDRSFSSFTGEEDTAGIQSELDAPEEGLDAEEGSTSAVPLRGYPQTTSEPPPRPMPMTRAVPQESSPAPDNAREFASGPGSIYPPPPVGAGPVRSEAAAAAPRRDAPPQTYSQKAAAVPSTALAADTPGARQLEGTQTPTLTLEKRAPSEVSVGQPASFEIVVRNVGNVTARSVMVLDRVPQGTELVNTAPAAEQLADGTLLWQLGDLEPGDQATLTMGLTPLVEGEIGSVAQVVFQAQASARSVSTRPELTVQQTGPERVLIGEDVAISIVLANPGSGVATGVVLEEDVPEGLTHVAGRQLEYEVGSLRPKEERRLQLLLKADKAGMVRNRLRVRGDGGLEAIHEATLEVIAPQLQVGVAGPRTRYLERQVTYDIQVANPGTAAAFDIQLIAFLPKGLRFVAADYSGAYDQQRHAVLWSLAELPAQEMGVVHLTALPIETGEQKLIVEGTGRLGIAAQFEHVTTVEALTQLVFTVMDAHDPIEVGSETTYEIRITNQGNKLATNIQVAAALAEELKPLHGAGPTRVNVQGQQVVMEPLEKLAPREEAVYRVTARGVRAGDHLIAVQISCDDVPKPVVRQESTKVYSDQ